MFSYSLEHIFVGLPVVEPMNSKGLYSDTSANDDPANEFFG